MGKTGTYIQASRFHLFSFPFGGITLGAMYGMKLSGAFSLSGYLIALLIGLFGHIATSFANELADDATDTANQNRTMFNGGTGLLQSGAITKAELDRGWKISALLTIGISCIAVFLMKTHYLILLTAVVGLILGIGYSLKPLVLSRRGLGEIAAFAAYGIPTLLCGAVLQIQQGSVSSMLTDGFFYLVGMPGALATFIILSLTMIPDTVSDRSGGRKSISVLIGEKNVIRMAIVLMLIDAALFALFYAMGRYSLLFTLISGAIPLLAALFIFLNRSAWKDPTGKTMMRIFLISINTTMAGFLLPALYLLLVS